MLLIYLTRSWPFLLSASLCALWKGLAEGKRKEKDVFFEVVGGFGWRKKKRESSRSIHGLRAELQIWQWLAAFIKVRTTPGGKQGAPTISVWSVECRVSFTTSLSLFPVGCSLPNTHFSATPSECAHVKHTTDIQARLLFLIDGIWVLWIQPLVLLFRL